MKVEFFDINKNFLGNIFFKYGHPFKIGELINLKGISYEIVYINYFMSPTVTEQLNLDNVYIVCIKK